MDTTHATDLNKLKNNFQNIWSIKNEILKIRQIINTKLLHLKTVYADMTKKNTKKMYLFCLDTFFFQYKTYSIEMENLEKHRQLINNRMYGDYYKLYNIISNYLKENPEELDIERLDFRTFTVYKDLEPFHEYNLDDIKEIHSTIILFITHLQSCYETNEDCIRNYNSKNKVGFSISNFLNTMEYENLLVKQQIGLYLNYLAFFHISQHKQLKRILTKLEEFDADIEENINIETMCSINNIADTQPVSDFFKVDSEDGSIMQFDTPTTEEIKLEMVSDVAVVDAIPETKSE